MILGIDQSITSTGIVLLDENGEMINFEVVTPHSKIKDFYLKNNLEYDVAKIIPCVVGLMDENLKVTKKIKDLTKEEKELLKTPEIERFNLIWDTIQTYINKYNITHIMCEGISFGSSGRVLNLAMLLGGIMKTAKDNDVIFNSIPPTSLKKWATGNGRAEKEDMIASVGEKDLEKIKWYGDTLKCKIDDICDAYHLAKNCYEGIKNE